MSSAGPGESPEWIEQGLRDALMRDGKRIIAALYNDRALPPDDEIALPFETIHRKRTRRVHTLFGRIELGRNYHHHFKSGTGRCPLEDILSLRSRVLGPDFDAAWRERRNILAREKVKARRWSPVEEKRAA